MAVQFKVFFIDGSQELLLALLFFCLTIACLLTVLVALTTSDPGSGEPVHQEERL